MILLKGDNSKIPFFGKTDRFYYIIVAEVLVYIGVWTFISLTRVYTLKASVFDLGVFVQSLRMILSDPSYLLFSLGYFPFRVILSPLEIVPNLQVPVIFQTVFLALPALPLYGAGKIKLKNKNASLLLASSYLIFFSLGGINWFDVHGQAFFIFLFIMGYYLFITRHYKLSVIFFILSGTVRFPYEAFPLIFGFVTILEIYFRGEKIREMIGSKEVQAMSLIVILSIVVLLISYHLAFSSHFTPTNLAGTVHLKSGTNLLKSFFTNIDSKISTLVVFLSPFIFLPFRKLKWFLLLLPYFYLVFFSNYGPYLYPSVITSQYSSMIIPFLYLGTIEGLSISAKVEGHLEGDKVNKNRKYRIMPLEPVLKKTIVIFIAVGLLAVVFVPYSSFSIYSEPSYKAGWEYNLNPSTIPDLEKIVALIPPNDEYILIQNNMPEVLLQDPYINNAYLDRVFGYPYNLTFNLGGKVWSNRIDYVLADINSNTFIPSSSYPYNLTMYNVISKLYSTGDYGIIAEEDGFILLGHNYSGPMIYYQPISETFSPSNLLVLNSSYRHGDTITGTNPDGHSIWYGPYTFLFPGQYQVTFHLSTTNNSASNSIELWLGDFAEKAVFKTVILTGNSFPTVNTLCNITVSISVPNFYNGVEFAGSNAQWSGSLTIYGITVDQVSG